MSLFLPLSLGSRSLENRAKAFYYTGADQTFNFIGGQTYTIYAWGAAGAYVTYNGSAGNGGYGAYVSGVFSPSTSGSATVIVGAAGNTNGVAYGGGGSRGGGRASIFINTTNILTMGGGGSGSTDGGTFSPGTGGNGGAVYSSGVFTGNGTNGSGPGGGGNGGSSSSGGAAGSYGTNGTGPATNVGTQTLGGTGSGYGGSGYYGGGGGGYGSGTGGGGGGSSYINTAYFSCISAAQGSAIATSSSLSGAVQGLYTGAGYSAGTPSSANTGHAMIIIVQNPLNFKPTYLPSCMLWLDATDIDGSGVTTTSTVLSLASFVPASPTTQEVSYSVSSQYYYSLSNWTPVSCVMNGPAVNGGQPQTANLAPSATTGIWYAYWNDGTYCKMVKLQFSITSGRIYVTAVSAGYVSSASSITSSTTGTQNDTIFSSATSATVATSSTTGAYGVQSFSIKTSGLPSNGTNITTWVDKSGNGNNASPSYGSSGVIPTYSNSAVFINNGGSPNYNSSTYTCLSISSNFQTGTNFSIFAVFNFTNTNAYQSIYQNQRPNGQTENRIQLGNTQTFDADSSGNTRSITGISLGTSTSVVSYLTSPSANYMYQNGVIIGSNTTSITEVSTDGNALPSIGGGYSDNRWATGYFNEIICYNGLLTSSQRRQVEMYLAWKWGLPTPLSTFSPTNITGLKLWLDAADTSTLLLNGSNVTQWNDKSGNNNHVYTTVGTPSNITDSGYSVVSFPSGGAVMQSSNYITISSNVTTVYAVCKSAGGYLFAFTDAPNSGGGDYSIRYNSGTPVTIVNGDGNDMLYNQLYINGVFLTSVAGTSNVGSNYHIVDGAVTSNLTTRFSVSSSFYSRYFSGNVCEIIVITSAITSNQRQQVEGYLAWKWGLYSSLSSTHPSYYSPPAAQVTFTPAQLSSLILWLDAADSSTITLSSSTVTQWRDKSIYNGLMTSGSPTYSSTRLNSLPAITTTTATPTYMTGSFGNGLASTQYYTLFFVFNYTAYSGGSSRLFGMAAAGNTDYQYSGFNCSLANTGSPIAFTFQNCSGSISPNSFTSSTGPTIVTVTVSGNTIIPSAFGIGTPSFGQAGNSLGADWSEVLIFNTTLTTAQQNQVQGYLAWKWGLQTSLPSSHPYYKASP